MHWNGANARGLNMHYLLCDLTSHVPVVLSRESESQRRTVGSVAFIFSLLQAKILQVTITWMTILDFLASFCNVLAGEKISCIFLGINFCSESQDYVWIKVIFFLLEKNTISLYQVGTWHCRGGDGCWNEGRFFAWEEANRKGFMRWRRDKERKWNQAVNLVAAIFDLCLSANSITTLWLNVHAHYALYSPSRPCKYSTKYSASFCPNIFFHLYCIKTLRPIIGERKNTIFLLYNAFHSQLLY